MLNDLSKEVCGRTIRCNATFLFPRVDSDLMADNWRPSLDYVQRLVPGSVYKGGTIMDAGVYYLCVGTANGIDVYHPFLVFEDSYMEAFLMKVIEPQGLVGVCAANMRIDDEDVALVARGL